MLLAANGPRMIEFAARSGDGWITTGPSEEGRTQDEWWRGVAEMSARFDDAVAAAGREQVVRCLSLDAAPVYSLSSRDAFSDAVGRAAELGFTDVVVHWPRSGEPYQGQETVLEDIAAELLPSVQGRDMDDTPDG